MTLILTARHSALWSFFFFNDTATTEIYTLSLHDALPISLVVTRLIFDWLLERGWLKSIRMLHIIRATKLDFMKLAKQAFIMSWLLILIGVGYGFHRGKSAFGVDFLGGDTTTFRFEQKVPDTQLR